MSDLDRNRANAVAFHELALNECRPREAIEQFVGVDYIQHNPDVPPGKSCVVAYCQRMALGYPGKRVEIKRTVAESGLVAFHCRQTWPGGVEYAGIELFRAVAGRSASPYIGCGA